MQNKLVTIDADTFYEGMDVGTNVYYRYDNNFILLCSKTTLDAELIQKLRHCQSMGWDLYVHARDADTLKEDSQHHFETYQPAETEVRQKPVSAPRKVSPPPRHLQKMEEKMKIRREYKVVVEEVEQAVKALQRGEPLPPSFAHDVTDLVQEKLETMEPSSLIQCINMMRRADSHLYIHSVNVSILNGLFAKWLRFTPERIERLIRTGILHDVGQCKIPPHILNKPGKLTDEEYKLVKKHPVYSFELAYESGERDTEVLSGIRSHHERMNGTGYPDGLSSEEISLFARVTAITDVYDGMIANRNFRDRNSPFDVLHQFEISRFSDLDLELIDVFIENMSSELVDKWVDLSNGQRAKVVHIRPGNCQYPLVKVKNDIIQTSSELRCVGMSDFLSVFN